MVDEKFIYTLKCTKCNTVGEETLPEWEMEQKTALPHKNCGGKVIELDKKPLQEENQLVNSNSGRYNEIKLNKIKTSTCKGCKLKPCPETPEMLNICQFEAFEYRLRSGKYNISSGAGAGEFAKDVKGVIIDGTPVSISDIKRLFVARYDTYCLQDPKDPTKFPDTKEPLTDDIILNSLLGRITIGVRPVNPETNLCKWICYDVDKGSCKGTIYASNPRIAVDEIVKRLKDWYGLSGYIELSGSQDSYHIWVFIEPTDNDIVWEFDQEFKAKCDPFINQAICKRVEQKSGHMIKLPYNIQLKNNVRCRFIDGIDISKIQHEKLPKLP